MGLSDADLGVLISCCNSVINLVTPVHTFRSVSDLLPFIIATGQVAVLHINFAQSAEKISAPNW